MQSLTRSLLLALALTTGAWMPVQAQTLEQSDAALERKDYRTAFAGYKKLAEQGNASAQFSLGEMYANGQGVPKDEHQAEAWFRKSYEQGVAPASPQGTPKSGPRKRGLWEMADDIAGPVAGIKAMLFNLPFSTGVGQQQVQAQQEATRLVRNLLMSLHEQFTESDRKAYGIEAQFWSNPNAYRNKLIAIENVLIAKLNSNAKILSGASLSTLEMRQRAKQSNSAINEFRERMGMPPRLKNQKEVDAGNYLKGFQFIDPDGNIRVVK